MADDHDDDEQSPKTFEHVLTPSEIVGVSMRLMSRNLAITSALQGKVGAAIRAGELEGPDAVKALASITTSSLAIERIHSAFAKRGGGDDSDGDASELLAQASAEKLLLAIEFEDRAAAAAQIPEPETQRTRGVRRRS